MQKEDIKFEDSLVFEGMTSIRAIIKGIDSGVNDRPIKKIIFDESKLKKISKEVGYFKAVSDKYGLTLENASSEIIDQMCLGSSHGGIIAVCGQRSIPSFSTLSSLPEGSYYALLQGIEDPYNFGYALRSLYACGCSGIILGERNWMSAAGVVCRSSAGASEQFNMYKGDENECVSYFKKMGASVICAHEDTSDVLGECKIDFPALLVVGGEKRGISKAVLEVSDRLIKIPYAREFRASLSAASATTMFAYEFVRQKRMLSK